MYNGGNSYHDLEYSPFSGTKTDYAVLSGGTGDLTDGFIPANSFWVDGAAPYVGWLNVDVSIKFFFNQEVTIDSLKISVDDTKYGVSPPSKVEIDVVEYIFPRPNPGAGPYTAEIQLNPPVTVDVATGLDVKLIQGTTPYWIFVSEVQIIGTIPSEAPSVSAVPSTEVSNYPT